MLHLRGLRYEPDNWRDAHPFNVPAVKYILEHGLDFSAPITFFVGGNGTGKTTVLESIAVRYPRIGAFTPHLNTLGTMLTLEDAPLGWNARLETGRNAASDGFFVRASTLNTLLESLEGDTRSRRERTPSYVERSHGEGLLNVLQQHFDTKGFYLLDEPETALSLHSQLSVVALLHQLAARGSQVLCATHSPILLSLPDAQMLEFGEFGIRAVQREDLELLRDWKSFLANPELWLRHLLA